MAKAAVSVEAEIRKVPASRRPTVEAARRVVRAAAPGAEEIAYPPGPPKSSTYMWKLVRYAVDGASAVGIGTYAKHSVLFFYRGGELDDGSGLLQGGGKQMRFVRLVAPSDAERSDVKRLVKRAFDLAAHPPG